MESRREKRSTLMLSNNKFKVLMSRVINVRILSRGEMRKDRKTILKEEKLKKRKKKRSVEIRKIKREKLLREVIIKIGLKQENDKKGIIVKALLDRPIYMRNIDSTFNYKESIEYIVEIKLFYKEHKDKMEINIIGEQKWSITLGIL